MNSTTTTTPLFEARNLVKSFDAVKALRGMSISIPAGEVTALVGDNGAGKSTLVRCLTGVHPPDSGELRFRGEVVKVSAPDDARALGVETVYQDLGLAPDMTVWQNLYLNRELVQPIPLLGLLDRKRMRTEGTGILKNLDVNVPSIDATVRGMSGGQRQSIAIARAVTWGTSLVIMDEPTAALGVRETAAVERLVVGLRDKGVTVLIISHDLAQVMRIADSVVVLRRGRAAAHRRVNETSGDELVGLITGTLAGDE